VIQADLRRCIRLGFSRPVIMLLIGGRMMALRSVAASGCLIDSNDILGAYEYFSMVEFY
jgi:hypothetical protein